MRNYLLLRFLAFWSAVVGHIVIKNNCNYKGNDLANEYASSPYKCGTRCANMPRCTHFTWVPSSWTESPHCWLKHAETEAEILASHERAREPGSFCGHLDFLFENGTISQFEISQNCDYKDNDLIHEFQDHVEGCASRCYENPSCTHFTWDMVTWRSRPICYLKYSSSKDQALATRVSKIRGAMCGFIREGRFGVATTVVTPEPPGEGVPEEIDTQELPAEGVPDGTDTEISPSDNEVTDETDPVDLANVTMVTQEPVMEDVPGGRDDSSMQP